MTEEFYQTIPKDIIPKLTVEFKVPVVTDQFKPKVKKCLL